MVFSKLNGKKIGLVLVTIGGTMLLCIIFFLVFGSGLLLNPGRDMEPHQTLAPQQDIDDSISIPGFEDMKIPAGKTSVSTYLYNPEDNKCYFEISILLTDTNEEIYKSKLVSPGQKLYQIELTKALEKGQYDAILHYSTFSLENQADLNGANVPFKLIVE